MARLYTLSTDKITVASYSNMDALTTFTAAAWLMRLGDGGTAEQFYNKGWVNLYHNDALARLSLFAGAWDGNNGEWHWDYTDTIGLWFHVAFTYDYGSTSNDPGLYINGVDQGAPDGEDITPSGSVGADGADLVIGNRAADDRQWNGRIAEHAYFNRILTAGEIKTLYYQGPLRIAGLASYLPLIGGSPEPNYTAASNNGTVSGPSVADHVPLPPMFALVGGGPVALPSSTAAAQKAVGITDITITFST